MDIDRIIEVVARYRRDYPDYQISIKRARDYNEKLMHESQLKTAQREVESVLNEYIDERVRTVIRELGLTPKDSES